MKLRVTVATVFKQSPRQSSELADHEKCSVAADREFEISHQESADGNHFKVAFTEPLENRTRWYVFADTCGVR